MQRYLRPDLFADAGVEHFDQWAATFGADRHRDRDGPDRRRQLPHEDPVCPVPERPGDAADVARVRGRQDGRGPRAAAPRQLKPHRRRGARRRPPDRRDPDAGPEITPTCGSSPTRAEQVRGRAASTRPRTTCSRSPATAAAPRSTCAWSTGPCSQGACKLECAADEIAAIRARATPSAATCYPGTGAPVHRLRGRCRSSSATSPPRGGAWNAYDELRRCSPSGASRPSRSGSSTRRATTPRRRGCSRRAATGHVVGPDRLDREDGRRHQHPGARGGAAPPRLPVAAGRYRTARGPRSCARATRTRRSRSSATSSSRPSTPTAGRPSNAKRGSSPRSRAASSTCARSTTSATTRSATPRSRRSPPATR